MDDTEAMLERTPPAGRAEFSRMRLLAMGWGLAALLPVIAIMLITADFADFRSAQATRTRLVMDAVERQLRDRLFLVQRQLMTAIARPDPGRSWVIPMVGLKVRPANGGEMRLPQRLLLGVPSKAGGRWLIPVSFRRGASVATAGIDTAVFTDAVHGYRLDKHDFISLIHEQQVIVARSVDNARDTGLRIPGSGMFAPERRHLREGRYTGSSVVDGIQREFYFRRLDGLPLAVMVGTEQRSTFATWARPAGAMLLVALLMAAAWGWLVQRFDRAQRTQFRLIGRLESALGALRVSDDRLRQAHALAMLGEYDWDPTTSHVLISGETAAILGVEPGTRDIPLERLFGLIHPEDRSRVQEIADVVRSSDQPFEVRYRVIHGDGTVRQVLGRGAHYDVDGRRVVRGVLQDVTELVQARERAVQAEAEYRFLFEHNPLPMWVFDRDSLHILAVNDAMVRHYGYGHHELVGNSMLAIRPPEEFEAMREAAKVASRDGHQGRVWTHLHKDGRVMRMQVFSHDIDFNGRRARLVAAQDVTEREQAEQRFQLVARATSDAVYDYDIPNGQLWWSESYFTRFGYTPVSAEPVDVWVDRIHPGDRDRVHESFLKAIDSAQGDWEEQYRYRRGDGTYATVLDRGFILRDGAGRSNRMVGGMLDISERQNYEDQLAYRATHDELTGLPNRQLLQDRLQQALLNAQRYGREGTLIFIDLDDFKLVNDTLGHSTGDRVLCEVANRLRSVARETDTVARFGGDEFVVVLTEHAGEAGAASVLNRITEQLTLPIVIGGAQHTLTASIGWCSFPSAGQDVETLLMHGDLAMYQAKRQGRNRAVPFQNEFVDGISRRLQLVSQIRRGLERDEFVPVFQPLFDGQEKPVALETLVRWRHPERGLLLPGEFIAVCEESGLIVELGRKVLDQAASHYRRLADVGLGHLRMAVNVSAAQFNDELLQHVQETMARYRLPADILELEITESLLMTNPERAIELMRQIAALGVSFSIDDFGTGYSSLAYLKRFPIDRLKIDRSFVRDLGADQDDAAICNSIIGLAHALDIRTVAEGVETSMQLDWLRERRIDEVQGYLLARPMPFDELLPLLQRYDARSLTVSAAASSAVVVVD